MDKKKKNEGNRNKFKIKSSYLRNCKSQRKNQTFKLIKNKLNNDNNYYFCFCIWNRYICII